LDFGVAQRYDDEIRLSILDSGRAKLHFFECRSLEMKSAINCFREEGYAHIAFGTKREQFPKIVEELKI
jgi:hypothetical protein